MRKRFLLISTIIVLSAFTFAACGKKSPSSPESTNSETTTAEPTTEENTEKDTTEEEKPVATATSEESTKEQTKTTTATKKDEQAKPKSATGTYNGFAGNSIVTQDMKKAISDMQKDQVLQEYQYFVGGSRNGGSRVMTQDEDGMVVRLG